MISCPKLGQVVQVWYRASIARVAPLHGRIGTVVVSSRGKPRNHGVEVEGRVYVVTCGNLRPAPPDAK